MDRMLTIRARVDGFRRAGRAWTVAPQTVPEADFSGDELAALYADSMLLIEQSDGEVGKQGKQGDDGGAGGSVGSDAGSAADAANPPPGESVAKPVIKKPATKPATKPAAKKAVKK